MKTVGISDFLTSKEITQARKLYLKTETHLFAKECAELIIKPALAKINQKLGQENDPRYLAYAVEYFLMKEKQDGSKNKERI
jgi:hypothetical protein